MDASRLGRTSLRLDALYCAVTGALVCALAPVLAPEVGVTPTVVALAGVVVGAWAAILWVATRRWPLRPVLWTVTVVNVVAAVAVGVSATLLSSLVLSIVLAAVAVEVAAFAVSQAVALTRLTAATRTR